MTKQRLLVFVFFGLLLALSPWEGSTVAQAQERSGWSKPHRLSSETGRAGEGYIVTDHYGYVHAFWSERDLPDDRAIIQYARFNGESWSAPVDIHATEPGSPIGFMSATVDSYDNLHLVWLMGESGPAYYTTAPAYDALSARRWSSPVRIDVPALRVALQVDSKGILHLLYAQFHGDEAGIHYLRSENQGVTWSAPIWLDPDILPNYGPGSLQFVLDESDGMHAVWYYIAREDVAADWVRYAHSLDGGITWSLPFTIDRDIDKDNEENARLHAVGPIMSVQGKTVHVIWAAGELNYRNHRISTDAGQTWGVPTRIFGNLNGQAGDGLAIDGAGRMHFFGQIRYPQGIWHAYWDQNHWVGPELIYLISLGNGDPIGDRIHAHRVRAVVRAGNQLVVIFTDPPADTECALYAMHRTLDDLPSMPAPPPPSPTLTPTPTAQPSSTPTPLSSTSTSTALEVEKDINPWSANSSTPLNVLWLALTPTLLLAGGVIVFQLLHKR
jgi:hypothetical protein